MSGGRPSETGATQGERWVGHFQPGYVAEDQSTHILCNTLDGIRTADKLVYIAWNHLQSQQDLQSDGTASTAARQQGC